MDKFLAALGLATKTEFFLGVALLLVAIALVVLVMMQSGKDKSLSGTIAGGAETFFGKNKTGDNDKLLTIITAVLAVVFVGIILAMYFFIAYMGSF